jgi:septal ring factor EnvC (AmiA/AmiB activator)
MESPLPDDEKVKLAATESSTGTQAVPSPADPVCEDREEDDDLPLLLGITAKSQEDIEDTVLLHIQAREREKRAQQLKKNITTGLGKLRNVQKQLAECENSLQRLYEAADRTSGANQRKVRSLLNDQERLSSDMSRQRQECRSSLQELQRSDYDFTSDLVFQRVIDGFWPEASSAAAAASRVVDNMMERAAEEATETEQAGSTFCSETDTPSLSKRTTFPPL